MKKIFIHVLTIALIAALAFGCLAGCTAAPKTEQVTPATPTTSATTETSADPAAATDLSGKKVALVLFGTNFDYFVYIGASAKKTAEEAGIQLDVLNASDFVDLSEKVSRSSPSSMMPASSLACRLSWLTIRHLAKLASPLSHMTLWLTALISAPVLAVTTMFSAHRPPKRQSSTSRVWMRSTARSSA